MNSMASLIYTIDLILYFIPSIRHMHFNIVDIFRNPLDIKNIRLIRRLIIVSFLFNVNNILMISDHFL